MTNDLLLVIKTLIAFTFIVTIFRWNKQLLIIAIVLNLLLVTIFGAKLISIFGFVTNNGNSFYAAVFFTTQLLTEQYGKKEAYKSIWIGACSIVFFMLMAQLTVLQIGLPQTQQVNYAIDILFHSAPRIALASVIAYSVSQFFNIWLFSFIKQQTHSRFLFLRIGIPTIISQGIDSIVFFTIAFYGTGSLQSFVEICLVGYTIKVLLGFLSIPFFYLSETQTDIKEKSGL